MISNDKNSDLNSVIYSVESSSESLSTPESISSTHESVEDTKSTSTKEYILSKPVIEITKEELKRYDEKLDIEYMKIVKLISKDYIVDGESSISENYIYLLYDKSAQFAVNILNRLLSESLSKLDLHSLSMGLHIISQMEYTFFKDTIKIFLSLIVESRQSDIDNFVIEKMIQLAEYWEEESLLEILRKLKTPNQWLTSYKMSVVGQISK